MNVLLPSKANYIYSINIFISKLQILGFVIFLLWGLKMFGLTIQNIGQTNSAFLKKGILSSNTKHTTYNNNALI
jgi:hypothetical protein